MNLNQGDRVPADCILIDEMMMKVDQSIYFSPDERKDQVMCPKSISIYEDGEDDHLTNPDPFLFSDSKIMTGHGKALVCQVGDNTLLAKTRGPENLFLDEEYTYLEVRLDVVSKQVTKYAKCAAFVIIITMVQFLIFKAIFSKQDVISNKTLADTGKIFITGFVVLIVSVPEGLPLAVSIAMAMSIKNLKED